MGDQIFRTRASASTRGRATHLIYGGSAGSAEAADLSRLKSALQSQGRFDDLLLRHETSWRRLVPNP